MLEFYLYVDCHIFIYVVVGVQTCRICTSVLFVPKHDKQDVPMTQSLDRNMLV